VIHSALLIFDNKVLNSASVSFSAETTLLLLSAPFRFQSNL